MHGVKKSSFVKREGNRDDFIKGTKPSVCNSKLLVSSGICSWDDLLGGGIPVGSLVLINEDEYGIYAERFLKYFLAEGIVSDHSIFLCSQDVVPMDMLNHLPRPVISETDEETESSNKLGEKKMKIAWRYENLKTASSLPRAHKYFGHYFDLSKEMSNDAVENSDIMLWSTPQVLGTSFNNTHYWYLLNTIKDKLRSGNFLPSQKANNRSILRIALHRLNSPHWQFDFLNESNQTSLFLHMFLYSLRSIIRNTYATCVITLPFSRCKKDDLEKSIHLSDIAIQLQSFAGTDLESKIPYKDYHGFFIIQKLGAINSLAAYNSGVTNFVFKLTRKKLIIEEFNLPPEMEDSCEREQNEPTLPMCAATRSNKFDF